MARASLVIVASSVALALAMAEAAWAKEPWWEEVEVSQATPDSAAERVEQQAGLPLRTLERLSGVSGPRRSRFSGVRVRLQGLVVEQLRFQTEEAALEYAFHAKVPGDVAIEVRGQSLVRVWGPDPGVDVGSMLEVGWSARTKEAPRSFLSLRRGDWGVATGVATGPLARQVRKVLAEAEAFGKRGDLIWRSPDPRSLQIVGERLVRELVDLGASVSFAWGPDARAVELAWERLRKLPPGPTPPPPSPACGTVQGMDALTTELGK